VVEREPVWRGDREFAIVLGRLGAYLHGPCGDYNFKNLLRLLWESDASILRAAAGEDGLAVLERRDD
jgi:hypothetical protein